MSDKHIEQTVLNSNDNRISPSHLCDIFLPQNGLQERWKAFTRRRFVIAETGFGTSLSFLSACQQFTQFRQANPTATVKELHFISFEQHPLTKSELIKATEAKPEFAHFSQQLQAHYPPDISDCHRIVLDDGLITLDLWFGDITDSMPQVWTNDDGIVDAWFTDFSQIEAADMHQVAESIAILARKNSTIHTITSHQGNQQDVLKQNLTEAGFEMAESHNHRNSISPTHRLLVGSVKTRQYQANSKPWFTRTSATNANDVAIIGGGVASATTALALIRRGVNVTLYCADSLPAEGASGNRQGAVYPLLNGSNDCLTRFFGPAFFYARQFVEQAAMNSTFSHDWCGVTQLAWDEKSTSKINKMLSGNFPQELVHALDIEQTKQKTAITSNFSSVYYPFGGWLCPQELTRALIKQAQDTGRLTLKSDVDICGLESTNEQWQLTDSTGNQFTHNTVIIANGHRFSEFEQAKQIPAYSVRGQVSHIPTDDTLSTLKTVLCYDGYLTPQNITTKTHCIGASYRRNSADLAFCETEHQDNKQRLVHCIPDVEWPKNVDISANQSRAGVRCASRDHLPFVGNICRYEALIEQYKDLRDNQATAETVPIYANLYSIVGLGSRGLSSAPLLGELLASQICGDPLPLPHTVLNALHPGRMWVRRLVRGKQLGSKS
ncbi:bifunctional tRNA (5-methylaminomethyl-2-thiouridine)(34)-methyltransferase MnmD/FAD-dependent 5-carboxymethylaminomethyl-2-thiouridine(34) oxidoreductase MnmC [Photobacterium frigidiphilum]|uniref:tRNA 5-methylaminomethyl-2-thiouridine biosynthesis bifunctional protein MnmC n=1 Tax=Photobacterium frigidiphilum TaxID=264736 RepID=A0A2T3JPL7_9GAMM|nr:bifunctional tRNA (5-methylaminomethyl-2-thiouridine)(34)-methyltransferase MnmD/FAD-dependent 5-carboxymethylaminomethyl-2-thiouridine(34) oxidoreductase MnmC [Photobacterium frigidiphilum]PSU50950.1 bifunctional tRNA (5-methylaminomethyl-2-thiouridine)(34)-methyltransferase MnmD/FAD-dependent 5-carboxymethylaminomethyl-2-thiouridine(34) oxidoreductase MnmC [Photobacterium frigidiphilum]